MTAALEPLRSTSFGEAKLAVAEQLCATELEAQTWRLRCFQAEAQLRLHRLHRRGEQHPRWPQDAAEQQQLLNSHASLKALDFTAIVQETLRDLVLSRTAAGHLQDLLEQTSHEVAELEEEAATKRARATSLSDGASAEDSAFAARERELEEEKETARSLAEKLRARSVLENDLAEQVALGQDQVERLQRQIQAFLPSQQQMQQEARQAQQESDKARSLAQRRREAVAKLEEEVQQVERSAEEEQAAVNTRLEQTRTELNETLANTAEIGEQARKAQTSHNRQMKAVKTDGSTLREALADVGREKEDMEAQLSHLRDTVGSASAADRERQERLAEAEAGNKALLEQVALAEQALNQAEIAHAEASGARAAAIKEGLQQARLTLSRAEEEAAQASEEAQEALQGLEALRAERTRLKGETGPEAAKRRLHHTEALTKEQQQLEAEQEQLKAQSRSEEDKLGWLRHLRDVQEHARSAARESANSFRVAYGDIAKSSRTSATARPGASPGTPAPEAANRAARKLSRHLDDFLRFMAEAIAAGEAKEEASQSPLKTVNLNLPAVLKEAYMGKFVQSDDGISQAQQLDSSKEKLKVLKRELNDTGHQSEMQSLTNELSELRTQITDSEAGSRDDQQRCEEAQARLREGFKKAGYRRNEAQTQAVQKVQRELGAFEREVAQLRRACDALEAEPPVAPAAGPSIESLGNKLRQKEKEVEEVRNRVMSTRERYHALVEEAGGRAAVEDLGFNVRYGSPRPLHRPCNSPPRRPLSGLAPGKPETKNAGEGRADIAKNVAEGKPDAKAAEGRPDVSKGIEEGEPSGRLPPEGRSDGGKDGAGQDDAPPAGASQGGDGIRNADDGRRDDSRNEGGASPSNKDSSTIDDKDGVPATPAVTPVATPAAHLASPGASETLQVGPPAPTTSAASPTPAQASPSSPGRSSRALSTPWGDMEAARPESTPQSCSELASPSQLNSALAEIRRSEAMSTNTPPLSPNASGQSLLRLEAAPSAPAESRLPSQVEVSSPARSIRPALAMSWADMEAALEPTPHSGAALEPRSPSGPSFPSTPGLRAKDEVEMLGEPRPEPALQCHWQPAQQPPTPPSTQPTPVASAPAGFFEPVTAAVPRPATSSSNVYRVPSPPPQLVASRPAQTMMPAYQAPTLPLSYLQRQPDGRVRVPSPPPVYLPVHSPTSMRSRSPSPHAVGQGPMANMAMSWTHIGHEASQFAMLPDFRARSTSPPQPSPAQLPVQAAARRRPSDFAVGTTSPRASPRAFSPRSTDRSPGISSRPSDFSPGTAVDSDLCSNSDVSRDVLGSPVSGGLLDDPWLGVAVRSPLRSPGRELRDPGRPAQAGPLRRPVPSITSPEWAEQAEEGQPVLPAPQLPALEELFAQNMREQREERKLRQQRREPQRPQMQRPQMQRPETEQPQTQWPPTDRPQTQRPQMLRSILPSFEESRNNNLCGFSPGYEEIPDDSFYGKHVKL